MRDFPNILLVFVAFLVTGCGGGDSSGLLGDTGPLNAVVGVSANEAEVGQSIYFSLYDSTGPVHEAGWQVLSAPPGSNAQLDFDGDIGFVWLIPDVVGSYTIRGAVFDESGKSDSMDVTVTAVNATPVAAVTTQREGDHKWIGETVELSGATSSDANDSELNYSWRIMESPAGSATALSATDGELVTLVADAAGYYSIELVVSDGEKQDTAVYEFYAEENYPPVIVIDSLPSFFGNEPVTIDASSSTDQNGDALTFTWELVSQPPGSTPVFEHAGSQATLTPDGIGTYDIHLVVSDGMETTEKTFSIAGVEEFLRIEDEIADAEYDSINDRIVLVSWSSSDLIVVDAVTGAILGRVDLIRTPLAVSVSPNGSEAVVGHDGLVSVVDLAALTVKEFSVSAKPSDIVHGGNGYAYVFPDSGQWTNIRSIDLATGSETLSTGYSVRHQTLARKQPGSNAIYGADTDSYPGDIEKYDISAGTAANMYDSPYHGDYAMCGNLWFTDDGAKIITACGNTFSASDAREFDMQYAGALELREDYDYGYGRLVSVDHSAISGMIASIKDIEFYDGTPNRQAILRHGATSYALIDKRGLPSLDDAGKQRPLNALFVFHQADTDKLLVVADIQEAGTAQTIILKY